MEIKTFVETKCITCGKYRDIPMDASAMDKLGEPYGTCPACTNNNTEVFYDCD